MGVLVTGASGFLGGHVVEQLRGLGAQPVLGLRRRCSQLPAHLADLPAIVVDLCETTDLQPQLRASGVQTVIHCAAYGVDYRQQDPLQAIRVNVAGSAHLLRESARAGVTRFVHIGTCYELGDSEGLLAEDAPLQPHGVYGASKAAATLMLRQLGESTGLRPLILRPFGLFGPREGRHKLVPLVLDAVRNQTPLALTAGAEIRDYAFVGDVARAIAATARVTESGYPAGACFHLCSGIGVSVRDFATRVAEVLAGARWLRFGELESRVGSPRRIVGNPESFSRFCQQNGLAGLMASDFSESVIATDAEITGRGEG